MSFRAYYHDALARLTVANKTRVLIQFTKISSLPILVLTEKNYFVILSLLHIIPNTFYFSILNWDLLISTWMHLHLAIYNFCPTLQSHGSRVDNVSHNSTFILIWLFTTDKHFCISNLCEFRLALRATKFLFDLEIFRQLISNMTLSARTM